MKIKLFFTLCFLPAFLYAWESNFELSEEAQQRAKFYNQFVQAVALEDKNPSEALILIKDLLDKAPSDKTLILEYCYLALYNYENDFNFCKTALENLKDKVWQHHALLGDYYLREGSLTQALSEYEQALKLNPENLELAFHYIGILANKDQAAAVKYLENLAKDYPQAQNFITLKIADIYLKNREEEKAILTLKNALLTTQNKAEIYPALIKIYELKKDRDALYKTYQDIERDGLADIKTLEILAEIALFYKQEDKARNYFQKIMDLDAQNPYAARYYAFEEQKQGRYEQALKYLQNSREFENSPTLQIKAGYYLSMLSKQEELLALMEQSYKKFPSENEIAYYYALALIDAKKFNQAQKVLENILTNIPENETVLLTYATLLYEQKDYKKMESTLRKLIEINPNNAEALNFLGYFLIDRKSPQSLEEGHAFITRALENNPQEIAYQDSLSWYYFKKGNYSEAQKIISTLPDVKDEEIYLHRAEIAAALKDFENAIINYEKALKIKPKNKAAKRGLKKVKKAISKS